MNSETLLGALGVMADDGDKNRKRRRVDKKDSNDDGEFEMLCQLILV